MKRNMTLGFRLKLIRMAFANYARVLGSVMTGRPVVLNYQMGKVGSSTVAKYLRDSGYCEWHIHRFYDTPVAVRKPKNRLFRALDLIVLKIVLAAPGRALIISGVRDPVSRDISMFFQVSEKLYDLAPETAPLETMIEAFEQKFPCGACCKWFDDELKRAVGIDVFAHPFDKEAGYQVIETRRTALFLYRLDKLDRLETSLVEFFDLPDYKLIETNRNERKTYSRKYSDFKAAYATRPHTPNLDEIRFMGHFFDRMGPNRSRACMTEGNGEASNPERFFK